MPEPRAMASLGAGMVGAARLAGAVDTARGEKGWLKGSPRFTPWGWRGGSMQGWGLPWVAAGEAGELALPGSPHTWVPHPWGWVAGGTGAAEPPRRRAGKPRGARGGLASGSGWWWRGGVRPVRSTPPPGPLPSAGCLSPAVSLANTLGTPRPLPLSPGNQTTLPDLPTFPSSPGFRGDKADGTAPVLPPQQYLLS